MRAVAFLLMLTWSMPLHAQSPFDGLLGTLYADSGFSTPKNDDSLSASCRTRAAELAASGELAHIDGWGRGPGDQAMAQGLPPGVYGEVLGAGPSPEDVWRAWLSSPSHRSVLMEPGWTAWGWGSAVHGAVTVYVVRFWKP
jgi:uncharacterized protein YkwD